MDTQARAPFHIVYRRDFAAAAGASGAANDLQPLFVCRSVYAAKVALTQIVMRQLRERYATTAVASASSAASSSAIVWGGTDLSAMTGHVARYVEPGPCPQTVEIFRCERAGWLFKPTQTLLERYWIAPISEYKPSDASSSSSAAAATSAVTAQTLDAESFNGLDAVMAASETAAAIAAASTKIVADARYESPKYKASTERPTSGNVHDMLMYDLRQKVLRPLPDTPTAEPTPLTPPTMTTTHHKTEFGEYSSSYSEFFDAAPEAPAPATPATPAEAPAAPAEAPAAPATPVVVAAAPSASPSYVTWRGVRLAKSATA